MDEMVWLKVVDEMECCLKNFCIYIYILQTKVGLLCKLVFGESFF